MAPTHIQIPPTPPTTKNATNRSPPSPPSYPTSPTNTQPRTFKHHTSNLYGFSPALPGDRDDFFHPDNIPVTSQHNAMFVLKAIQKAKAIVRNKTLRSNEHLWQGHLHTLRCTACRKRPAQNPDSITIQEPNQLFKSSWFKKATTNPELSIVLCPQCMFDSPWVAASQREVHITAPTFSSGWSTTAAKWQTQKSLYTKNALVSFILNYAVPPQSFITAERILQQAKRPMYDVDLDAYEDDIANALSERRTTQKPKPCNKRILNKQLNIEQKDKRKKLLTPSPRKRKASIRYHSPTTSNVNPETFALAARTTIHDAAANTYHQHHIHRQTNT